MARGRARLAPSATVGRMVDPFIAAAGPAPARGTESRWRQVALLAASSAIGDAPVSYTHLTLPTTPYV